MSKAEFDAQRKYLWSLVKQAGWDKGVKGQKYSRYGAYLMKTFNVTHANVLSDKEVRQAIATIKPYAAKAAHDAKKKLRMAVMAHVAKLGYDLDWLHERMVEWGYGNSMRKLSYKETKELFMVVRRLGAGG